MQPKPSAGRCENVSSRLRGGGAKAMPINSEISNIKEIITIKAAQRVSKNDEGRTVEEYPSQSQIDVIKCGDANLSAA